LILSIGKNHIGALVTVVDRKSKFTLIKNVPSKEASVVTKALIEMIHYQSCYSYNLDNIYQRKVNL